MIVKLFEDYNKPNREETLLGLAKMGLRTGRREVFDLAVKRGFDKKTNFYTLRMYCVENELSGVIEWIFESKTEYENYKKSTDINLYNTKVEFDISYYVERAFEEYAHSGVDMTVEKSKKIIEKIKMLVDPTNLPYYSESDVYENSVMDEITVFISDL